MADGWAPGWKPATDEEIVAMCSRLTIEPATTGLLVDAVMMLQRCRMAIDVARGAVALKAEGSRDE